MKNGNLILLLAACFAAIAAISVAQPLLPQQAPAPAAQSAPPSPIARMYAIHAQGAIPEQPHMDDALKAVAPMLKSLPFTTYRALSVVEKETPWGEEVLLPINAVYSMHVTAASSNEEGAIDVRARVEMLQGADYVNALDTHAQAAPNKALLFRGMPLGQGELVIALMMGTPQENGQSGDSSQDAENEQTEEQENKPEQNDEEEQETEGESAAPQEKDMKPLEPETEEGEMEGESPEGVETLEALLESLEETDRREQIEERNRRDRIDFKGEWW